MITRPVDTVWATWAVHAAVLPVSLHLLLRGQGMVRVGRVSVFGVSAHLACKQRRWQPFVCCLLDTKYSTWQGQGQLASKAL